MKEPDWKACTEKDMWLFVAGHLASESIETVLVGGAVVSIYSEGAYRSGDLDLVTSSLIDEKMKTVMKTIGFSQQGRLFIHPQCKHLYIDFVSGPLGLGDDLDIIPDVHLVGKKKLKILSPTDCIRDRLASYIYFKSRECLDQAVLVAKQQPFKKAKIKKWCQKESALSAFSDFEKLLKKKA